MKYICLFLLIGSLANSVESKFIPKININCKVDEGNKVNYIMPLESRIKSGQLVVRAYIGIGKCENSRFAPDSLVENRFYITATSQTFYNPFRYPLDIELGEIVSNTKWREVTFSVNLSIFEKSEDASFLLKLVDNANRDAYPWTFSLDSNTSGANLSYKFSN